MPAVEVCATEDFVAEVTAQVASLEEAGSAQEILTQQIEGYLNRLREAMCADLTSLQVQLDACDCTPNGGGGGLPDLVDNVEISSGREVNGFPTFFKMRIVPTLANNGTVTVAHNIVPALPFTRFIMVGGTAWSGVPAGSRVALVFSTTSFLSNTIYWFVNATDISVVTGSDRTTFTETFAVLEYYYA